MDELFWATRTGRWRSRMKRSSEGPLERRLYRVICDDIEQHLLPAGAVMPTASRVATELGLDLGAVADAFRALQADGFLMDQPGKGLCIVDRGNTGKSVGDNTQILFEKSLLSTARRAAAQGMSTKDASGIFRAPRPDDPGK
jgi:DNA-binding GntR family transcriptional regulator